MMRRALILALFLGACSEGPIPSAKAKQEACSDVRKEYASFQNEAAVRARNLKSELGSEGTDAEAYPELADAQQLLELQTELEAREKQFAARLQDCAKATD